MLIKYTGRTSVDLQQCSTQVENMIFKFLFPPGMLVVLLDCQVRLGGGHKDNNSF